MSSSLSPSTPSLELPSIAFFGRTLAEYARFFALDPAAWVGRSVLDVAAGPASFTTEAAERGIAAVAVDPLYGYSSATLAAYVQIDYARMLAQMRAKSELLRFRAFASIDEAEASRRTAAERFLADYEDGFLRQRYVGGRLPHLPFRDRQFDLVLCAHLLFTYSQHLGEAFHLSACRELLRVSAGEVRLHPLCGLDGRPCAFLDRLIQQLASEGVAARIVPVDYEFFAGSTTMLVLQRKTDSPS